MIRKIGVVFLSIWLSAPHSATAGRTPAGDEVARQVSATQAVASLVGLRAKLSKIGLLPSSSCRQFITIARQLSSEISDQLVRYARHPIEFMAPSDQAFEMTNRLQIAMTIFSELEFLMSAGAEGGYSVLDWSVRTSCPIPERQELSESFSRSLEQLTVFFKTAFGTPSAEEMNSDQRRLLRLMLVDEDLDQKKFWYFIAGGTVASLALWEFAPPALAFGIQRLWGATPRLLTIPAVLFGAKVTTLSAEALVFSYADRITSSKTSLPPHLLGSWQEHMNSIQTFLQSSTHSPDLELAFLSRVHANLLPDENNELAETSSTRSDLAMSEMLRLISGATTPEQLRRLQRWLSEKFRYRPECETSLFGGFSETQCLMGIRSLATSLIAGRIPMAPELIVTKITKDRRLRGFNVFASLAEVRIPFNSTPASIETFLTTELTKPAYEQRTDHIVRIENLKNELEEISKTTIEFDHQLDNLQILSGLYKLHLLAEEDPTLLQGRSELLKLSNHSQFPYEQKMKLKETLDVMANLSTIRTYLQNPLRWTAINGYPATGAQPFFVIKNQIAEEQEKLTHEGSFERVICSSLGSLNQLNCLRSLKKFSKVRDFYDIRWPKIDIVIFMDVDEMPILTDYYLDQRSKKFILLLQRNFNAATLFHFSRLQGW